MSTCITCQQRVTKNRNGIKCSLCTNDFHLTCTNPQVNNDLLVQINQGCVQWCCQECKIKNLSNSIIVSEENEGESGNGTLDISQLKHSMNMFASELNNLQSKQDDCNMSINSMNFNLQKMLKCSEILTDHENRISSLENSNKKLNSELSFVRRKLITKSEATTCSFTVLDRLR